MLCLQFLQHPLHDKAIWADHNNSPSARIISPEAAFSAIAYSGACIFFSFTLLLGMVLYDNFVLRSPKVLFCSVI